MSGVIEWYYKDVFQSRRSYKHRQDRKGIMDSRIKCTPINNRHNIHFVVRPHITLTQAMEIDKEKGNH